MSESSVPISQRFFEPWAGRSVVKLQGGRAALEPASPSTETELTVRVARRYGVAAQRVFDAWLQPEIAVMWLFATATRPLAWAEVDARVGGRFRLVEAGGPAASEWTGEYLVVDPHRHLVFTLSIEPKSVTRIAVEIVEASRGCRLSLEHEGVPRSIAKQIRQRWIGILYGLDVTLRATASVTPAWFAAGGRTGAGQGQGIALALEML